MQPTNPTPVPSAKPSRIRPLILLLLVACAIGASVFFDIGAHLERMQAWISDLGPWGPAVFISLYAVLTTLAVPGSVLTLAAGALFGLVRGVAYTFIAAMIGSCGAFLLSRHLARNWVKRRMADDARFTRMDAALGQEGLKIMALLRLSPIFPFNFLNYALGLTGVSFRDYVSAGFAMLPGTILFVYYGFAAGSVAEIAGEGAPERGIEYYLFMGVGLAATIAVTAVITRIARKSLRDAAGDALLDSQTGDTDETTG